MLNESTPAFWSLLVVIRRQQARADLRALLVAGVGANPGAKGEAFRDYSATLSRQAGDAGGHASGTTVVPGVTPGVSTADKPGEIATLRRRQAENAERRRHEWEARKRGDANTGHQ